MSDLSDIISRNVVESLPVGLLIVDQTGAFVTVNPAAAGILGYAQPQLLGRGWGEFFFENDANHLFNQVFVDVIQKELVGLCREVPYITPQGATRQLSITSSYLQSKDTSAGVVVILHDMTELSRMQRRETEILKEINSIQEEKIRGLSKLAASVAHQIRNPAFAIGGFAARLDRQIKAHGLKSEYPAIILDEARRLETIVTTVGKFATLEPLHLEETSLVGIVDAARHQVEVRAGELSRTILWKMHIPETTLVADGKLLATALKELFCNSLEHADHNAVTIEVTASVTNGHIELSVSDNGPGVAPQDRPHIFDPFYSSRPEGIGMGLPLVQEILLEHNGQVTFDGNHAPGARFFLSLPLYPRHLVSRLEEEAPG